MPILSVIPGHVCVLQLPCWSVIMEYLVNISKRRAFWSLNEDILKINYSDNQYGVSIKEDSPYSAFTHQRPQRKHDQYAVSSEDQYAVLEIGNRANQIDVTQSCSIKTFRASGAKEFFGTEGAVGLLTWFENIEFVLHVTKFPAESQVEFAASMLQGRALTWWNTLVQTRGRASAIAQPWKDFKS
ncbi:hypothetical protein Tco_0800657 [Tanacetum coccineum]|uniref:Reverse transcriptase domain-containing protein n=1 Tax=Tanacetum coccineum TaxID=301880 RepID=A0ABQ4ZTR9_9ASTR